MKKIIKSAAFALTVAAACMLPAACTNDDLNSPDPARTPLAITEIGIGGSNLNASPATRIATDPASGAQAWEEGDAIRVFATLKGGIQVPGATLNPDGTTTATSTYIYKVGSGWTQTPAAGETTLYVDDVQTVSRVETYGGRTQYDPATDYLMQADPGAGGNPSTTGNPGTAAGNPSATAPATYTPGDNYRLNDCLADEAPVLASGNGSAAKSLTARLSHRRIDLVLRVADGAAAPSIHALPDAAYLQLTLPDGRTLTAWRQGKATDTDDASPTNGKEVTTFRAIVEVADVPGVEAIPASRSIQAPQPEPTVGVSQRGGCFLPPERGGGRRPRGSLGGGTPAPQADARSMGNTRAVGPPLPPTGYSPFQAGESEIVSSDGAAAATRAAGNTPAAAALTYSLPAGPHELGTLVYPGPTDAAAPDPSATPREKRLSAKYTLSATAATPLAAGDRIVITATFMDNLDQLTADNVKIAPFEDGNGPDGEHVVTGETAYGNGLQPLNPDVFNAERTTWVVSGGGTDDTDATVLKNVRDALDRLDRTDPANQGRIDLVLSDVGKLPMRDNVFGALDEYVQLHSVSAPRVTEIGESAFYNCSALTAVSLPRATGDIGDYTFFGCEKLQTIDLPEVTGSIGRGAFQICKALTTVSLPLAAGRRDFDDGSGAGTIGLDAFNGCTSLQTVSLPKATGDIGNRAFQICEKLTDISLPEATGSIGKSAFNECYALTTLSLPKVAGSIGENAFAICGKLQTIDLPAVKGSIGAYAFYGCIVLPALSLPLATGSIGENAFKECEKLQTIDLKSITGSIGENAFKNCKLLKEIDLPLAAGESDFMSDDGSGTIAPGAFSGCGELEKANLPLATGSIGENAFYGCKKLKEIDLPKADISIGQSAFDGCKALTTVKLPGVEYHIGRSAFGGCESLTTVDLSGVTGYIGEAAFRGCAKLQTLSLPKARRFDDSAFSSCISLTSLDISGVTDAEDIPEDAFAQFDDKGTAQSPKCDLILSPELYNDDTVVTSSAGGTKNTFRGLVWKSIKPAATANAAAANAAATNAAANAANAAANARSQRRQPTTQSITR